MNAEARQQVDRRLSWGSGRSPTQRPSVARNVGRENVGEWVLNASTADLWAALTFQGEERRYAALGELAEREDPCLAPTVIAMLSRDTLQPNRYNVLIRATPCIQVTDDSLREMLAASLLDHANRLKNPVNDEEESVLCTAIRRYATLRPQADIGKLVAFLAGPDEPLPRRHVVLLAIQNAFYATPPSEPESAGLENLRARVSFLAHRYLDKSWLATPDGRAVAQGSYCAAAALGCADLLALTEQNRALNETWLREFTHEKLSQMLVRWSSRKDGAGVSPIHDSIRQAIIRLAQTAD